VSAAGTAASIGASIAGATAAIPVIGAAVAGVEAILALFHVGQGCGQACVTAAETEQIFEVAGWDVELAATAGMITQAQAVAALQWLQAQGQATLTQLEQSDPQASKSLSNLNTTIGQQIAGVQANSFTASDFSGDAGPSATPSNPIPTSAPTVTLDPTALENSIFVQPGASGWYPNSVSQGASLALQAIADATGVTSATSASSMLSVDPTTGNVTVLGSTFSETQIVVGLGLAGLLFLLL
jgi:hypothetical protein